MYICPTCNKRYATKEEIKKHSMICWKKTNSHYKSKTAPRGEIIVTKEIDNNILNFFNSFKKENNYDSKN